jgi:hypothetical protein
MTAYEAAARTAKAAKLAAVLIAHGATAAEVHAMPRAGRAVVAQLAGTRPPSPTTWLMVAELVDLAAKSRAA